MSDNLNQATDNVTAALTDEQLDAVAGGWLGLVGVMRGDTPTYQGPSRQTVEEITGCRLDIGCLP